MLEAKDLAHFTGTETWWKNPLHGLVYTDGAKHVAEEGGAYWLLDQIGLAQKLPPVSQEEFQVWKLTVSPEGSATLVCEDGNDKVVCVRTIPLTDFPLPEIKFYHSGGVLMLPSEY